MNLLSVYSHKSITVAVLAIPNGGMVHFAGVNS